MCYADALDYDDERFRRLTGVKKATFQKMLDILNEAHARKKARGGRPNKLPIPEMLMMTWNTSGSIEPISTSAPVTASRSPTPTGLSAGSRTH